MTFKELLIKEVQDMEKVKNEIYDNEVFTKDEKHWFHNEIIDLKKIISYIGD